MSKRADAPYRSGPRPEWVKTKCDAWREANRDRGELFQGEHVEAITVEPQQLGLLTSCRGGALRQAR